MVTHCSGSSTGWVLIFWCRLSMRSSMKGHCRTRIVSDLKLRLYTVHITVCVCEQWYQSHHAKDKAVQRDPHGPNIQSLETNTLRFITVMITIIVNIILTVSFEITEIFDTEYIFRKIITVIFFLRSASKLDKGLTKDLKLQILTLNIHWAASLTFTISWMIRALSYLS